MSYNPNAGGGLSNINISAGTTSNNLSNVIFNNSNGVTFGLDGSTVTASAEGGAGLTRSFWANIGYLPPGSSTRNASGSSILVMPFFLPYAVSMSHIRIPVSISAIAATAGTPVAAATFSARRGQTDCFVIYSQGVGASSRSIQSVCSGSAGWTLATNVGAGANSSQYTVSMSIVHPHSGFNSSTFTTSYAISSASIVVNTTLGQTRFTGARLVDIPIQTLLNPGNYWIAFGRSTSTASQSANISFATNASLGFSTIGVSQNALSWGIPGFATSASDNQPMLGQGIWTTNSFVSSTASMALSQISNVASNPALFFEMIRQA